VRSARQARADAWVRWARSPELDDDFWLFHLRRFLDLLPAPGRLTVDVGCGEGRLTRALAAAGYRVVGADTASALVKAALTHPRSAPARVLLAPNTWIYVPRAPLKTCRWCQEM
jgi:2-polyprenyl-3-methyl-5-hydroxy-6-metoxy-1,4-benzoquinol methylase